MCVYCEQNGLIWYDDTINYDDNGISVGISTLDSPTLVIRVSQDNGNNVNYASIPISYCPVCGRKLD